MLSAHCNQNFLRSRLLDSAIYFVLHQLWCNQQYPDMSRKICFFFLGTADFSYRFLHISPEIWTRSCESSLLRSRIISNSSFQENPFWRCAFSKTLFWKPDFKISQLQNVIVQKRIFGRSDRSFRQKMKDGTEKEKEVFSTYVWVSAEALCIYNTRRWIFKSTFIPVQHDKWRNFAIFEETFFPRQTWTYFW